MERNAHEVEPVGERTDVSGTYPELTADVPVGTGELVVHVGTLLTSTAPGSANYVPFTLAATQ